MLRLRNGAAASREKSEVFNSLFIMFVLVVAVSVGIAGRDISRFVGVLNECSLPAKLTIEGWTVCIDSNSLRFGSYRIVLQ